MQLFPVFDNEVFQRGAKNGLTNASHLMDSTLKMIEGIFYIESPVLLAFLIHSLKVLKDLIVQRLGNPITAKVSLLVVCS